MRPFRNLIITDAENEHKMMWKILKSQGDRWKTKNPTEGTKIYPETPLENIQQLWSSMFDIYMDIDCGGLRERCLRLWGPT